MGEQVRKAQELQLEFDAAYKMVQADMIIRLETLVTRTYQLATDPPRDLNNPAVDLGERVAMAHEELRTIIKNGSGAGGASSAKKPEITEGGTARNIKTLLVNEDNEYALENEDVDAILSAAALIYAAPEILDEDGIREHIVATKTEALSKKLNDRPTEVSDADWSAQRTQAEAELRQLQEMGPSEQEVRTERVKRTVTFLEEVEENEKKAGKATPSNTQNELRTLETNIAYLRYKKGEDNSALLGEIQTGVTRVKSKIVEGAGKTLFKDARKFLASKLAKEAVKAGVTRAAATAVVTKGFLTAISAAGGPVGIATSLALQAALKKAAQAVNAARKRWKETLSLGASILTQGAVAAFLTGLLTVVALLFAIPVIVALILFIINSGAYIVPSTVDGLVATDSCANENLPKPSLDASQIKFSADGKYAFPLAPFDRTNYTCGHWDGLKASDMGINGISEKGWTGRGNIPVVAYTTGTIESTSLTDPKGGKYIILAGDDGRFYYYAHNCALYVTKGQRVTVGEVLATTDNTGSAKDSIEHLHFAISSTPNFVYAGTVCPSTDFEAKFKLGRCAPESQCPAL